MDTGRIDLKKLLSVSSGGVSTNEKSGRVSYSKEALIILSRNPPCHTRPDYLREEHLSEEGLWDPEKWHRSTTALSMMREEFKKSDLYDDLDNDVILGPQRRSFQGGCHVAPKEKSTLTYSHPVLKPSEREGKVTRQLSNDCDQPPIHVKRFHTTQNDSSDWSKKDHDDRRFDKVGSVSNPPVRKRRQEIKKYVPPMMSSSSRRFDNDRDYRRGYGHRHEEEEEPEWISYGPKSQFDTIELSGFDEPGDFSWMGGEIPMDDVPERKKNKNQSGSELKKDKSSSDEHDDALGVLEEKEDETASTQSKERPWEEKNKADKDETKQSQVEAVEERVTPTEVPQVSSEVDKIQPSNDIFNHGSRFSRWFSGEITSNDKRSGVHVVSLPEKLAIGFTNVEKDEASTKPNEAIASTAKIADTIDPVHPGAMHKQTSSRSTGTNELHGTAAFSRLIASIRATDSNTKDQRNQKMQTIHSVLNTTTAEPNGGFNSLSVESMDSRTSKRNLQANILKQNLEKTKAVYQQNMRKVEQAKLSRSSSYLGQDADIRQALGFSGRTTPTQFADDVEERRTATALLAAKLMTTNERKNEVHKIQENLGPVGHMFGDGTRRKFNDISPNTLNSQAMLERETLRRLKRLQSCPADLSKIENFPTSSIALLAIAGVPEEQFKQLTLQQQQYIFSMVMRQHAEKKREPTNFELRNKPLENSASIPKSSLPPSNALSNGIPANVSNDFYMNKLLNSANDLRQANTIGSNAGKVVRANNDALSAISMFNDSSPLHNIVSTHAPNSAPVTSGQSHLLSQNLMAIPTIMPPPVVPLMTPGIAPHILAPGTVPPHLAHLIQTPTSLTPPHNALLLQQQVYATHLAAQQQQQQQQAFLALLQKKQQQQQLMVAQAQAQSNQVAKFQQDLQNLRLAAAAQPNNPPMQERAQFANPLAQWFNQDVLSQPQFPPVTQLPGQTTLKIPDALYNMGNMKR